MTAHRTKEERRKQIVDAALTCFAQKGYYETSMDDIVKAANLSKGSLYWHFKNKRDLFMGIIEVWLAEFSEGLEATLENATTATQKLYALGLAIKESSAARPELVRAQLEFYSMAVRDDEYRAWIQEGYEVNVKFLEEVIEEGIATGEFRQLPSAKTSRMILAYLDGAFLHREINDTLSIPDLMDDVMETILTLLSRQDNEYE